MKKIILLLFTIILLSGCYKATNPQRFKGAVVVNKTGEYYYAGYVNFKDGNAKGELRFEGESLEDVYNQIYKFCEGL